MTMARFEIGEPSDNEPFPPDNSPETWHVHDDIDLPSWGWGIHCTACYVPPRNMNISGGPMWNLSWLRNSNAAGQTAEEMKQEIYAGARESGRDLQRAR